MFLTLMLLCGYMAHAQLSDADVIPASARAIGNSFAKCPIVFEIELRGRQSVRGLRVVIQSPAGDEHRSGVGMTACTPYPEGVRFEEGMTRITTVLFLTEAPGNERFVFPEAGRYSLQWYVYVEGSDEPQKNVQTLEISVPRSTDLDLLRWFSEMPQFSAVVGSEELNVAPEEFRDWLMSPAGSDLRAIGVLGRWFRSFQDVEPFDHVSDRDATLKRWSTVLREALRQYPDCCLAPYMQYALGAAQVALVTESELRTPAARIAALENPMVVAAAANLDASGQFPLLRARAQLQKARLLANLGALDAAERLILDSQQSGGGRSSDESIFRDVRREVASLRSRAPVGAQEGK
jgi:hypothetical protein